MLHKQFSKLLVDKHYGSAPKIKMNRKLFDKELQYAYLAGSCNALLNLSEKHTSNPFNDIGELIGGLHELYAEYGSELMSKHVGKPGDKITVDDIVNCFYKHKGATL
jgi:hypothetical protein